MIRSALISCAVLAAVAVTACAGGRQYAVIGTEKSIGVDGLIEIKRQREDINLVSVDLVNLPPPQRHDEKRKHFVVWITPSDGPTVKAGRLSYDEATRRGVLECTTPNNQVYVQVTAEASSKVKAPSDFVVMAKHVSLAKMEEDI